MISTPTLVSALTPGWCLTYPAIFLASRARSRSRGLSVIGRSGDLVYERWKTRRTACLSPLSACSIKTTGPKESTNLDGLEARPLVLGQSACHGGRSSYLA